MSTVLDKFLRYVKIDTQSQDGATTVPSTDKQRNLASLLAQELNDMGAQDVVYDKAHCYVYATIPSNLPEGKTAPVIGFISHMDTSPAVSGENVNPRVVAYEGGDIVLNAEKNIVLTEKENPELAHFVGKHLIVTDGNTLLGADDKAGVAEIMTMAQELLSNKSLVHGKILVMAITGWSSYCRLVRSQIFQLKNAKFIEASRSMGASGVKIVFEHILVNIASPLIVQTTMELGGFILLESTLSFLGLGIEPPGTSLGVMVSLGRDYMLTHWWLAVLPSIIIVVLILDISLIGDWLRDRLDPKLKNAS